MLDYSINTHYRDIPFGLSVLPKEDYEHAFKAQVDGEITKGWARRNIDLTADEFVRRDMKDDRSSI